MTIDIHPSPALPVDPPSAWAKPTLSNTKGGKLYRPTHPDLFKVEFTFSGVAGVAGADGAVAGEESFSSRLVAARTFIPGEIITPLTNLSRAQAKAYSSVQYGVGPDDHFELNSDLLFMNHSCAPTAYVELPPAPPSSASSAVTDLPPTWLVRAGPGGVPAGSDITFFYPSTEWDMAQGFECGCGAKNACLGQVRGAKYLSLEQLEARGYVNEHIRALKRDQRDQRD